MQHHLGLLSTVNLNITEENQMSTCDLKMKKRKSQQDTQRIGLLHFNSEAVCYCMAVVSQDNSYDETFKAKRD